MFTSFQKLGQFHKAVGNTIFGWAFVSTIKGEPYFDTGDGVHSDHIPADTIVPVSKAFMRASRMGLDMHTGSQVAEVVHSYPMTNDIMQGNDITSEKQGLMIGWDTEDEDLIAKVAAGERIGFSIGGRIKSYDIVDVAGNIVESIAVGKRGAKGAPFKFGKVAGYDGADGRMLLRVFREWDLGEISLVDYPMQEPALIGVMKGRIKPFKKLRTLARAFMKGAVLTSSTDGHQHVIDPASCDTNGTGCTSWSTSEGSEYGHDHAWVRDTATGAITIAENEGHSHTVEAIANPAVPPQGNAVIVTTMRAHAENLPNAETAPTVKTTTGADEMDPKDKQIADLTAARDSLALAFKRAMTMTEPQRLHYVKLSEEDRTMFLAKSGGERDAIVKSALDADPAFYTAKSGRIYRQSESELGVMAKRMDEQDDEIAKARGERDAANFAKVANESVGHFSLDATKGDAVALVKAIHAIDDKDGQRTRILTALKGADAVVATTMEAQGGEEQPEEVATGEENAVPDDGAVNPDATQKGGRVNTARAELTKMAEALAAKDGIRVEIAKSRLIKTNAKAIALYHKSQHWDRQRARNA